MSPRHCRTFLLLVPVALTFGADEEVVALLDLDVALPRGGSIYCTAFAWRDSECRRMFLRSARGTRASFACDADEIPTVAEKSAEFMS